MGCGCGKSSCLSCCGSVEVNSGCCSNVSPATPLSASCNTSACQENHCVEYINQQFHATLKVANSWNVPSCGGSAVLYVAGIKAIAIGSYVWADGYGYFEVVSFNAESQQITVQNNCTEGNAPEGTQVPACTEFTVVGPPLEAGAESQPALFPYVAIDFTAPNVSTCLLITVTTVNGLVVGKTVQIGSGTYRVNSIPDGTHIEICNDGAGITPGTAVIAQNEANQYQYPIILIDTNPCTNPTVTSGSILVCKDDVAQPLTGPTEGAVPVLIDPETGEVEYQFFPGQSRTCASILCCLTIVSGFAGPYVITVSDSSEFVVGDLLQIGSRTDRFTITSIVDGTHIQATVDPVPGATTDIDVGTTICIADCCEIIEAELEAAIDALVVNADQDGNAEAALGTVDSGNLSVTSVGSSIAITNLSTVHNMVVLAIFEVEVYGACSGANSATLQLTHTLETSTNGSPFGAYQAKGTSIHLGGNGSFGYDLESLQGVELFTLAPSAVLTVAARSKVTWVGAGSADYTVNSALSKVILYGVAV